MPEGAALAGVRANTGDWLFSCPDHREATPDSGLWCESSGEVRAAFAGSLFEPEDLAARLKMPAAAAENPARLVLEAYLQLGDGWLRALRGRYAIVVDDRASGRISAARDAMGQYPLFFSDAAGTLLFSNSTERLVSDRRVSPALNRVALTNHLVHRWSDPTETYFTSVSRVPPGHVLEIQRGTRRIRRYWDPVPEGTGIEWLREDEVGRFDAVLERAVGRCFKGPAGIFLSGGFDSISVAAVAVDLAHRQGRPAPRALSLGFPDPACNEEFVQRGVAQALGIAQDLIPFDDALARRGLLASATALAATWPVPMLNLWAPAYLELARRGRERGCLSILTGSGGDEWLTVTPYLSADLIRSGKVAKAARLIQIQKRSYRMSWPEALHGNLWTFGLKPLAGMTVDRFAPRYWRQRRRGKMIASTPRWLAPDPSLRAAVDERAGAGLRDPQPGRGGFYEQEMRTALEHPLMTIEAEEHFEFGRRAGTSMTHPYWDADLVELLYRTPPWRIMQGGRTKALVRDTVARRFPNLGFERQRKVTATNFYWTVLQREGRAVWNSVGKASALAELGIVDPTLLADTLDDLFAGNRPYERYRIWTILHLEAWVRSRVR